jgi:PAS domain S-box-containing protein
MRLNTKMLLMILIPTLLLFVGVQIIIGIRFKNLAFQDAKEIADSYANEYASKIAGQLNVDIGIARGLAKSFSSCSSAPSNIRDSVYRKTIKKVLENNPKYIAVFLQWELNALNNQYDKPYGRRRESYFRKNDSVQYKIEYLNLDGDDTTGIYYQVKTNPREYVIEPYFYSYSQEMALPSETPVTEDAILETTIIIPIMKDNQFVGMTGMDIPLKQFSSMLDSIQPFPNSYAFLVSNKGTWVTHPLEDLVNKPVSSEIREDNSKHHIEEKIKDGKKFSFMSERAYADTRAYLTFSPVKIGHAQDPWSLGVAVPTDVIIKSANQKTRFTVFVAAAGILFLFVVIWFISKNISTPVMRATSVFQNLARGEIDKARKIPVTSNDEIGMMSLAANKLIDGLNQTADFAKTIGQGNLNAEFKMRSNNDVMGHALMEMRNNLKQSKEELEKLSIVASRTDNVVLIADREGNIEWVNKALTNVYGYQPPEIVGMNLADFSTNIHIKEYMDDCIRYKRTFTYETYASNKGGEKFWTQTTITPIIENDEISRLVAIDTDISRIKEIEAELRTQKENLEHLNAMKDKFFTIIAHDMKNPFASLISITGSLAESYEGMSKEEVKFYLKRISKSANLLHNLLDNLLQWATSQTGNIDYNPEHLEINEILHSIGILMKINADKKDITIHHDQHQKLSVFADKNMLLTILRNLVSNAIKYSETGSIVNLSAVLSSENEVMVSVEDQGIGLSNEDIGKLFRIDVKTKSIGTSKEKGTGLGLILCKEFVERNGGQIWVESQPNKGSTFKFTLPVRQS